MTEPYDWPHEIQSAVAAFETDLEWQVLGATVDSPHTGDELVEALESSREDISEAVSNLTQGGIVARKNKGRLDDPTEYTVELSEYGGRFVEAMFGTLGDARDGLDTE
jgi:biotin operon repressor